MEMHQVRYFLAVCETLNFTRAAEKCNVTQPALSRAIQALEDEMGGLLFRRERGLTHLTDLGRLMMPHLEQVLRETEAAKSTARGFLKMEDAPLNLGVMCTIGPMRFGGFLARFRADNPGVELSLMEGSAQMLNGLLQEGRLDVAVMAQPTPYDERYDVRPLYQERFAIGFPAGHRFAQLNAIPIREMSGESYLFRASCEYGKHLGDLCRANGVELRRAYRSEREDWIQVMIVAGLGVCFLPEYSPIIQGVQTRMVTDPDVVREVSVVTVSGRRFSPAVARFVNAIKAHKWPDGELPGGMG